MPSFRDLINLPNDIADTFGRVYSQPTKHLPAEVPNLRPTHRDHLWLTPNDKLIYTPPTPTDARLPVPLQINKIWEPSPRDVALQRLLNFMTIELGFSLDHVNHMIRPWARDLAWTPHVPGDPRPFPRGSARNVVFLASIDAIARKSTKPFNVSDICFTAEAQKHHKCYMIFWQETAQGRTLLTGNYDDDKLQTR